MLENSNGNLPALTKAGLELPTNALEIFSTITKSQPISIILKLSNNELYTLQFEISDLKDPDRLLNRTVGATIEALLNQISLIQLVQNKS
ncbi:hypothetical protein D3C80_1678510 [compost metagenome]